MSMVFGAPPELCSTLLEGQATPVAPPVQGTAPLPVPSPGRAPATSMSNTNRRISTIPTHSQPLQTLTMPPPSRRPPPPRKKKRKPKPPSQQYSWGSGTSIQKTNSKRRGHEPVPMHDDDVASHRSSFKSPWADDNDDSDLDSMVAAPAVGLRGFPPPHQALEEPLQGRSRADSDTFVDPLSTMTPHGAPDLYGFQSDEKERFTSMYVPREGRYYLLRLLWCYLRNFHIVLLRGVWLNSLLSNLASPKEKVAISTAHGIENGPTGKGAFNYVVWRRSVLFIILIFAVIDAAFDVNNASKSLEEVSMLSALSQAPLSRNITKEYLEPDVLEFFDLPDPRSWLRKGRAEPFEEFLKRMGKVALARLTRTTAKLVVALEFVVCFFAIAIVIYTLKGMKSWLYAAKSADTMRGVWALAFLSPFLSSLIPFRLWFDLDSVDDVGAAIRLEWQLANIDAGVVELENIAAQTCRIVIREAEERPIEYKLLDLCANTQQYQQYPTYGGFDGKVERLLPKQHYDFSLYVVEVNVNLLNVHATCGNIRSLLLVGLLNETVAQGVRGCYEYEENLAPKFQSVSGPNALDVLLDSTTKQLKLGSEVFVSVSYAVLSLRIMIPAALALAPGFLRGSLKTKGLVPQNSIPGMFTLVLPWLYCPLTWSIYNILFQLVGNWLLLLALFLMSFSPMVFFAIGYKTQITRPMDDVVVYKIVLLLWKTFYVVVWTGHLLLVVWFFTSPELLDNLDLASYIWNPRFLLSMLASGMTKFQITTLACVDWILINIIEQRYYELYLLRNRPPLVMGGLWLFRAKRRKAEEYTANGMNEVLREQRDTRLDEVSKLFNPMTGLMSERRRQQADAQALVTGVYDTGSGRRLQLDPQGSGQHGKRGSRHNLHRNSASPQVEGVLRVDELSHDEDEALRFGGPTWNPDQTFRRMHVTPDERNPMWELYDVWGYISTFHLHIYRGLWLSSLAKPMAGPRERRAVNSMYGTKMKIGKGPNNFMAWRRSSILITLLLSIFTAYYAFVNMYEGWVLWSHQARLADAPTNRNVTYNFLPRDTLDAYGLCHPSEWVGTLLSPDGREPFDCYTQRLMFQTVARMTKNSRLVANILDVLFVFCNFMAMFALWFALRHWLDMAKSTRLLRYGWLLSFAAPLVVSLVPVRLMVDSGELTFMARQWLKNFARYSDLDRKREIIDQSCVVINEEAQVAPLRTMWVDLCGAENDVDVNGVTYRAWGNRDGVVEQFLPHYDVTIPLVYTFYFETIAQSCGEGRELFRANVYESAVQSGQSACATYEILKSANQSAIAGLLDVTPDELDGAIQETIGKAMSSAELVVGVWYALIGLRVMLPAALALAPGLIRASLKMKSLVPQSSLPGMFVLIMPWLYCPLVWCVYNTVFQMIGNGYLMVGTILLAYAPMSFFFFGVMYNVTRPMDDKEVLGTVSSLWRGFYVMMLSGYAFCGVFFLTLDQERESYLQTALTFVFTKNSLFFLISSMVTKYFFTTLVSMDWLLRGIVEQRWYDIYLLTGSHPIRSENEMQLFAMKGRRHRMDSVRTMLDSRIRRLDQLCLLWREYQAGYEEGK